VLRIEDDGVGSATLRAGLGLELCDRLAAQLGSSLELTSTPDRGTRASFRFRT
jgi:two-component sensor histidine kinase